MQVQVLGPVRAWRDGTELELGGPHQRTLLALLAIAGGQPVSRTEIVDALWPSRPPRTVTNVIQTRVKRLRRVLDPERPPFGPNAVLLSVGDGYALKLAEDAVDVARFRALAEAGRHRSGADARQTAALLDEALRLWHGNPLADMPMLAGHPQVVALLAERRTALNRYGVAMIAIGAAADALPVLERAGAEQPLDEATQAGLMRAYQAAGQPARAFATYHETRHRLAEELGMDPGAELAAAHVALLRAASPPATETPAADGDGRRVAAGPPPAPVPSQLPADVFGFIGRADQLSLLDSMLEASRRGRPYEPEPTAAVIAAISGTAGVGKTALAVHWSHRVRRDFPDGQLYLDLRGHHPDEPVAVGDALARLLTALGVPAGDIPPDLDDRAARYRTGVSGRRMLVLLDNAASAEQVRPLLPGTPSCVVVVTSRDRLSGLVALHGARRVGVDLLPLTAAVELLRLLIGPRVAAQPRAAQALAQRCARLPLALRVAAELAVARPHAPLGELVDELTEHRARLEMLDLDGDPRGAVRTVFSWSHQRLPADAARAFRLLGLHPGPDADRHAIAALWGVDLDTARRLAARLTRAHLAQPTTDQRIGMHDLLAEYAAELAGVEDEAAEHSQALSRLFDYYLAACATAVGLLYPADQRHRPRAPAPATPVPRLPDPAAARAWLDAEREVLVALCAIGPAGYPARLAETMYKYLEHGHYPQALKVHTLALDAAVRVGDLAGQASALTSLGAVHRLLGHYGPATEHLNRAIAVYRRTDDRHGQARALSNLGIVDERTGGYDAARHHHESALALYRTTGDRYGEAATLNNLAAVYSLGHSEAAIDHYRQALALYRELGDRVGAAIALSNLGTVNVSLGEYQLALAHQQQALILFRELGHRYGEANVLNNLGDAHRRLGHYESALDHQQQALALFRELGQPYGEAAALNGLGEAQLGLGRNSAALDHHSAAIALALRTGDRDEEARGHAGAAEARHRTGDHLRAREHRQHALRLYQELGLPPQADEAVSSLAALDSAALDSAALDS